MSEGNLIDPEGLAAVLEEPGLVVLDASWYLPAQARDPEAEFLAAHIPGARRFDFDGKIKDHGSALPHMLPAAADFEQAVRALGVSRASRVVVYDGAGIFAAPRAWWMFKAMGHRAVAVLDGGLPAWRAAGKPLASGPETAAAPGDFVASPDATRIRDAIAVKAALAGGETLVDARSAGRFEGREPEPRAGLRSGHMPGARNLPFDRLIEGGSYRSGDEIRETYRSAGVGPEATIVTTCGSGVTAAVLALGAELAGLGPAAVYDGSWSEWGQEDRADLPVVTGPA